MGQTQEYYLYTENLTVGYNGQPLIRDIKIGVRPGEILTLIGPNGAGKTTILKTMIRQLSSLAGVVYLDGRKIQALSGQELSEKMSVVLTDRVHSEMMSCEEVVATGRYPYTGKFGVLSEEDHRIVREAMELVHIADLAERDFDRTSDGQKQRIMLARALCQQPDIIVLDEPTSFLDMKYKLEFLSILQRMTREKHLAVVMSLHELDLAERISDHIACIKGDRVDRFGTPEEIFTDGYIPKLYDMTVGSFEEPTGTPELAAVPGEPQVFVIAGCGTGLPVYRRLQRQGIPFATGILFENDMDYPTAKALAARVISVPAFSPISRETLALAKEIRKKCGQVICTVTPEQMGPVWELLKELL